MTQFSIELAKPSDDRSLGALVVESLPAAGVDIILRRNPSFLQGVRVQGPFTQVGVIRQRETGEVVGCATRSIRSAYINGTAANLGYLAGLWLDKPYRRGTLLARGYRAFHQLHRDRKALLYLAAIPEDDREVRELLTAGRGGLPRYDPWGTYHALVLRLGRTKPNPGGDVRVVRGSVDRMPEIEDCLNRNGRRRQFYPCYLGHEFLTEAPHLRDFRVEDFYLAIRSGRVVGVAGRWDQGQFRQVEISGYHGPSRFFRPAYNLAARLAAWAPMPPPAVALKSVFLSFIAVDEDDPDVFRAILESVHSDAIADGYACLLVGFHERDPLLPIAASYPHFLHRSRLHVVYWEDGAEYRDSLDDRIPYLEFATM